MTYIATEGVGRGQVGGQLLHWFLCVARAVMYNELMMDNIISKVVKEAVLCLRSINNYSYESYHVGLCISKHTGFGARKMSLIIKI